MLAEEVIDPNEIWVDWVERRDTGALFLVLRYVRTAPNGLGFASFHWLTQGLTGATVFSPTKNKAAKPNPEYLETMRNRALLWRRKP
jgi:phage-Barnase-EndoU-ColicinE5/D-RelE like nuclease2